MRYTPNKTIIGGFLVIGIMAIVGIILWFSVYSMNTSGIHPVMYFNDSVKGLAVGSSVMFRGVPVGKVDKIELRTSGPKNIKIPVYIVLNNDFVGHNASKHDTEKFLSEMILHGLKARLDTQSVLTGQMTIELDYYPTIQSEFTETDDDIIEIPTISYGLQKLSKNLEDFPIKNIGDNIDGMLVNMNRDIPQLVAQATNAVESLNRVLTTLTNTDLAENIASIVRELNKTTKSVSQLTDYLERHPEAIITGKKGY